MKANHDQAEYLAQVETGNHLLKRLLTRPRRVLIDGIIVRSLGKNDALVIKSTPLAVDGHGHFGGEVHVRQLGDVAALLHVRRVAARAEDATNLDLGVSVSRRDQSTSSIIDQRRKLDG